MAQIELGKLNGLPVIAAFKVPERPGMRPGEIVMVDKGPEAYERYIVSTHSESDDHWGQGEYYSAFTDALDMFQQLVAREYSDER